MDCTQNWVVFRCGIRLAADYWRLQGMLKALVNIAQLLGDFRKSFLLLEQQQKQVISGVC